MRTLHCLVVTFLVYALIHSEAASQQRRLRRPVALGLSSDRTQLYVLNRNAGSISVVDTLSRTVSKEITIGGRLVDLATWGDHHLLTVDEQNHQLVSLNGSGSDWEVESRLSVSPYPVQLLLEREQQTCFVASLWSRTVTRIELSDAAGSDVDQLETGGKIRLPFEPRQMRLVTAAGRERLIVSGAFAASFAIIDPAEMRLIAVKQMPGHNIRGLALSHDRRRLLITGQQLNPLARSTRDDVHWGNMLANLMVVMPVDKLCDPDADILQHRITHLLGAPGNAAGDPGSIQVTESEGLAIIFSGVNQVALADSEQAPRFRRVDVGSGPNDAVIANGQLFSADTFSDTISVVDIARATRTAEILLGPQPRLSLAERGEVLFFDSRLSHDGWMSCHSCHSDGHSNAQLNDNFSDGSFEAAKRVLSLMGVGQTGPWAWSGQVETLEQQVKNSIEKTMQGDAASDQQISALVAYLKSIPAPPRLDAALESAMVERGRGLFRSLDCQKCHAPPTFTTPRAYDVGLSDAAGNTRFNPPSLRGVGRRQAFFHDARTRSLRDVFVEQKHQLPRELSTEELDGLIHYLNSI